MKRAFVVVLASTLLTGLGCNISLASEGEKEITFRDIPWGTAFPAVDEQLGSWELWNMNDELLKTYSADDILLGDYKGIDFEYSGMNIISNAFNGEQSVAGYTTSGIKLYFAFLPVDGYLTYDESDTALYGAQYEFKPTNREEMYNDLTNKLSELYGEPAKVTDDSDMWGNAYTYTYWYGANDTELVLRCTDATNDTTDFYDDEIFVSYVWRGGDDLLQQGSDAIKKEKSDKEDAAREVGSSDGL